MPWEELLAIAIMALFVLGPPPLIYLFLFKPENYVAWHGRWAQENFYSKRISGKEWTDEEIDGIPWPSWTRFWMGVPRSEFVRYAADAPERLPRVLNQVRIGGLILFLMWCVWTPVAVCGIFHIISSGQG